MPKIINSEEKKLEICRLAYERFLEDSIIGFSLNKFIETLNMSKGQFYYYFKSKEELIFEAVEIKSYEIMEVINKNISQKTDFLEKIFEYFAFYLNDKEQIFIDGRKILFETMHLYLNPKHQNRMKECEDMYLDMIRNLEDIFDEAIQNRLIKEDSKKHIKIILAAVDGIYFHSLVLNNYDMKGTMTDYLTQMYKQIKC